MKVDQIKELALFALNAAQMVGANSEAFQALAKRIGTAVGGSTEAELATALDAAVKGRKAAHKGMQDAGRAR